VAFVALVFAVGVFTFTAAVFAFAPATLLAPVPLLAPAVLLFSVAFVLFGVLFGARLAGGDFALDFKSFFMGNCLCFFLLCAA
jgi:hypothetical protein